MEYQYSCTTFDCYGGPFDLEELDSVNDESDNLGAKSACPDCGSTLFRRTLA